MAVLAPACAVAAACGRSGEGSEGSPASVDVATAAPVVVEVADRAAPDPTTDPALAGAAIAAFGTDLLGAVLAEAPTGDNVIVSPASVAIALAMLERARPATPRPRSGRCSGSTNRSRTTPR